MEGWLAFCDVPDIRDLDFILFYFFPSISIFDLCLDEIKMTKDPITHSRVLPCDLCRSCLAHRRDSLQSYFGLLQRRPTAESASGLPSTHHARSLGV